jgi:vacuolar protein sorting-associated protein 13A/C
MDIDQSGRGPIHLLKSASSNSSEGLLAVRYCRAQPESPVFESVYHGINQNVDIKIAAVLMNAAPEPLIEIYDFIMSTFVPQGNQDRPTPSSIPAEQSNVTNGAVTASVDNSKINVDLKFAGVQGLVFLEPPQLNTYTLCQPIY